MLINGGRRQIMICTLNENIARMKLNHCCARSALGGMSTRGEMRIAAMNKITTITSANVTILLIAPEYSIRFCSNERSTTRLACLYANVNTLTAFPVRFRYGTEHLRTILTPSPVHPCHLAAIRNRISQPHRAVCTPCGPLRFIPASSPLIGPWDAFSRPQD